MAEAAVKLKKIRLEMARGKEFPEGSKSHGYEIIAPLSVDGHLDAAGWRETRALCRVRRFWGMDDTDIGHLVHRQGGSWAFRYDVDGDEDDEAGYRLNSHLFVPGEYVSIKDEDGILHTFQVVRVEDAKS